MAWYKTDPASNTLTLTIHAQPGAKKSEIAGLHGDALKIRINAPPVEGKANEVLVAFIAKLFSVPRKQVHLLTGETSRHKRVEIVGSGIHPDAILK